MPERDDKYPEQSGVSGINSLEWSAAVLKHLRSARDRLAVADRWLERVQAEAGAARRRVRRSS
jgi:hypothetical protein